MPPKTIDVRIDEAGRVVTADRRVHADRNQMDKVHFKPAPGKTIRIDFSPYLAGSPFATPTFDVPPNGVQDVVKSAVPGPHKYDVYDLTAGGETLTDDPEVVIE